MIVRDATGDDLPAIRDVYNALIETTTVAWTEVHETLEQRRSWFEHQTREGWPVLVAEDDGGVDGFAAYGAFRGQGKWPGYRRVVIVGADAQASRRLSRTAPTASDTTA